MEKKNIGIIFTILFVLLIGLGVFGIVYLKNNTKEYTVTFNSDGGSNVPSQTVKEGGLVTKPNNPVKEGYTFVEWLFNGRTYDFSKEVNSDLTLVASYQENISPEVITYEVTFDNDGILEKVIIEEGKTVSIPNEPTKEGYNFLYWTLNNKEYDFNSPVTKDITLVAKWEKIVENKVTYNVIFDTDGGSRISTKVVEEGKTVTKPSNPTKNGYEFVQWQLEGKTYNFNSKVTENITLKAVWKEVKTYSVTFNTTGGSSVPSQTVKEGAKATKPTNPTREGYTFDKWLLNGNEYNFNLAVNSNITLVATWKEIQNYTVSFNTNGAGIISSQVVKEGAKATKPNNPSKSGYTFTGWTLNGKAYDFNSPVSDNITLVANFKQKSYTISVAIVDEYSPDRVLTVYENGTKISVLEIKYLDGDTLCSGSNTTVNKNDIAGENSFIVVLSGGTTVTASVS